MSKFSVIVTVYNKERYIYNTLKSIESQTFKDFELIIVNDGSNDNSLLEIEKGSCPQKIFTIRNSGVSNARNYGVKQSKGEYIAFLDGDDIWKPTFLERIENLIKLYPEEVVFATAAEWVFDNRKQDLHYSTGELEYNCINYFDASREHSVLHPSTTVIKKTAFYSIGFFNTKYSNYEDIEYWFRLGSKYKIAFCNRIEVSIIKNDLGLSSKKEININDYYMFNDYNFESSPNKHFNKVLAMNLFSLIMVCKKHCYNDKANELINRINSKYLTLNQKLILVLPHYFMITLYGFKKALVNIGVRVKVIK